MDLKDKLEVVVAGVKTRFRRLGKGSPMLAISGLLGGDAMPAAEAASTTHETYAPDPPGFRDSEPPSERLTMEFLAGRWKPEFHAEAIGRRAIVGLGFSAGASALIQYAATHPGAVEKLVLYEPIIRGRELPTWLKGFIVATFIPGAASVILKTAPHLAPLLPGVSEVSYKKRLRLVEGVRSPRCAGELGRSLLRCDLTQQLTSLEIPVLIIRGDGKGGLVPPKTLEELSGRYISHMQLPGLRHFAGGSAQVQIVEAAREFLQPSRHL
ncbi:MAG: alpha/beta hydrolase [Candidatus Woykebacteria bacterium]